MKKGLAGLSWSMRITHQLMHPAGPTSSGFESVSICSCPCELQNHLEQADAHGIYTERRFATFSPGEKVSAGIQVHPGRWLIKILS
jgi:hypothetical protein